MPPLTRRYAQFFLVAAFYSKGVALSQKHEPEKAIPAFLEVVSSLSTLQQLHAQARIAPPAQLEDALLADTYSRLGLAQSLTKAYAEAVKSYTKAIDLLTIRVGKDDRSGTKHQLMMAYLGRGGNSHKIYAGRPEDSFFTDYGKAKEIADALAKSEPEGYGHMPRLISDAIDQVRRMK
jgi:hypothetical protein